MAQAAKNHKLKSTFAENLAKEFLWYVAIGRFAQ